MSSNHLFFIKILHEALSAPDPAPALEAAFTKIEALGQQGDYRQGYEQFMAFMSLVKAEMDKDDYAAAGPADQAHMTHLAAQLQAALTEAEHDRVLPGIVVEREGETVATIPVEAKGMVGSVGGLLPGLYSIKLTTGRQLWAGALDPQELLWRDAFPEEALPLAADTDGVPPTPSKEFHLLGGEIVVRVIPGMQSGRLEIFFNG